MARRSGRCGNAVQLGQDIPAEVTGKAHVHRIGQTTHRVAVEDGPGPEEQLELVGNLLRVATRSV